MTFSVRSDGIKVHLGPACALYRPGVRRRINVPGHGIIWLVGCKDCLSEFDLHSAWISEKFSPAGPFIYRTTIEKRTQ